jgi:phosphate transport system permease protein
LSRLVSDRLVLTVFRGCALLSAALVGGIALFLVGESLPALANVGVGRWLGDPAWHPAREASDGQFLLVPMIAGTLAATACAVLLAAPVGLASAAFAEFYAAPLVARWYRHLIELLAGIPSVVYGFWGLVVLVPWIRQVQPPGASLLAASLILAVMILPTIALLSQAALAAVPRSYIHAAAALGLNRTAIVWRLVFPAAISGIFTAILLAAARALGETMAVLMVAGNVVQVPASLFAPMRTLTANIALELGYAMGDHRSTLFASGLLLLGMVVLLTWIAGHWERRRVDE